ncbi:hypothetical protein IMZ48_33210 [Candidatus Bathyarchaeota archaeon]|nr:hypothetical protein [Candidatus Bathyarchaeota archaeon]
MQLREGLLRGIPLLDGRGDGRELADALRDRGVEVFGEVVGETRVLGGKVAGALEEGRREVGFRVCFS